MHGFPFFFWSAVQPASPGYTPRHAACQEPGLKIFGGVLPFLRSFGSGVSRAPGASQLSPEDHPINGGFPGVWEIGNALFMLPVAAWSLTRALEKWRKAWSLGDTRLEFHPGDPGCNLSTGYPHLVRWGVWEFELSALVGRTCLSTLV